MMIKQMDLEFITILMEQNTKETGKMIFSKEKELKHGQMEQNMKDNIKLEKSKEKELIFGQMDRNIVVLGLIIK